MTKVAASEAKVHFGALLDRSQREPVVIEKQGRPVAVVISYSRYLEQRDAAPSEVERKQALRFLNKWVGRSVEEGEDTFEGDIRAQAIWDKYTQST